MTDFAAPWLDPAIAVAQRESADKWLALPESEWPPHFRSFADAVRATKCPGSILELGCGVGHGREILDRAGIGYRSYGGIDISGPAIALARERYPESRWSGVDTKHSELGFEKFDIAADGSCLLHVEDWRGHLAKLCAASRRWIVLHRVPVTGKGETRREDTSGYGHTFPAWCFVADDVTSEMRRHGFELVNEWMADGHSVTVLFAKPRHFCTYADSVYLPKLKALYASLVKHAGPFKLHVLGCDGAVVDSCHGLPSVVAKDSALFLYMHPELQLERLPGPPRSVVEHYWTCGPQWIADVMEQTGEPVTYVDADCMLHSSPERMFAEIGDAPAGFAGHNFMHEPPGFELPTVESHSNVGLFNVGVLFFSDPEIVKRWTDLCREWCYARIEAIEPLISKVMIADRRLRYGDQHFLEDLARDFPGIALLTDGHPMYSELFPRAKVIDDPACMVGPWNAHSQHIEARDGVIYFGGRPLVSYHYSSYVELPHGGVQYTRPEYQLTERQIEVLYLPYIDALAEARR